MQSMLVTHISRDIAYVYYVTICCNQQGVTDFIAQCKLADPIGLEELQTQDVSEEVEWFG